MSNTLPTSSKSELDLLKFFAIILITNSHINHLYPIPSLGTGGSLGNAIFFLVSAIGLTLSLNRKKVDFGIWFYKRASRTYLITWVATILFLLIGYYTVSVNIAELFHLFIFPTGYWFIPAITLFYIPLYFVITNYSSKTFLYTTILTMLIYFGVYFAFMDIHSWTIESVSLFKWIFYFEVMVVGVYVANKYDSFVYKGIWDVVIFILLTVFFFAFKFATTKINALMPLQFLLQLVTIPWVIYFLKLMRSNAVYKTLHNWKYLSLSIVFISSITLEIYLLQSFFYNMDFVKNQIFPINLVFFAILLTLAAWALSKAYNYPYIKK